MTVIEFRNVSFRYESTCEDCLSDISLNVDSGEFVVLTGKSGCGKTTMTRLINGLIPHFYHGALTGKVILNGRDISDSQSYEIARHVGSVFQDPRSQFFTTNSTDELAFGCENLGIPSEQIQNSVETAFVQLQMWELKNRSLFQLSSGQKQKIALASAHAMRPEIYVLDEPSANLDKAATLALKELLRKLKAQGKTVIISEHRLSFLMSLADRILYIDGGRIRYNWMPQEIQKFDREELRKLGLRALETVYLPANLHTRASLSENEESPILDVRHLSITLGCTKILKDISFSVRKGEIIGITGKNGTGKTTLARTLCGVCRKSSGEIRIDGKKTGRRQRSKLFSFVMQDADYQLFTESVEDELRFGNTKVPTLNEKVEEALTLLDLEVFHKRHPLSLSGGQKQRVTIAAATVNASPIIILDEPTSGLDGEHMERVGAMLRTLVRKGKTILVISHDTEFLSNVCDHVFNVEQL